MSYSKSVLSLRTELLDAFQSYLSCARGIDDLHEEGDFDSIESMVDGIIEDNVAQFKQD